MKLNFFTFIFFAILLFNSLISNKKLSKEPTKNNSDDDLYNSFKSLFDNKFLLKNIEIHKEKVKLYLKRKLFRPDLPKPDLRKIYTDNDGFLGVMGNRENPSVNELANQTDFLNIAKYLNYVKFHNLTNFDTILDVGAGIGRLEKLFGKYFKHIDVLEEFPKFQKELKKIKDDRKLSFEKHLHG
jgi:hypothetical protein